MNTLYWRQWTNLVWWRHHDEIQDGVHFGGKNENTVYWIVSCTNYSWISIVTVFLQTTPWHPPQASTHLIPCVTLYNMFCVTYLLVVQIECTFPSYFIIMFVFMIAHIHVVVITVYSFLCTLSFLVLVS